MEEEVHDDVTGQTGTHLATLPVVPMTQNGPSFDMERPDLLSLIEFVMHTDLHKIARGVDELKKLFVHVMVK